MNKSNSDKRLLFAVEKRKKYHEKKIGGKNIKGGICSRDADAPKTELFNPLDISKSYKCVEDLGVCNNGARM